ncbi:hypothetical protein Dimus_033735 [Dionaea muscipula]
MGWLLARPTLARPLLAAHRRARCSREEGAARRARWRGAVAHPRREDHAAAAGQLPVLAALLSCSLKEAAARTVVRRSPRRRSPTCPLPLHTRRKRAASA